MTQNDWPARLAGVIAEEVKRHRKRRKMSAQQLADKTADLGMPIPRSVLANLESKRRPVVSVAEVLILARALDVSPLALVFPVGFEAEMEVLPGEMRPAFRAAQWAAGERPFPGSDDDAYLSEITADWNYATGNPLTIFREYDWAVTEETQAMSRAARLDNQAAAEADDGKREGLAGWAAAERGKAEARRASAENLRQRAAALKLLDPGAMLADSSESDT
jgi:transcriptional regulator with XRE-family HTH domain